MLRTSDSIVEENMRPGERRISPQPFMAAAWLRTWEESFQDGSRSPLSGLDTSSEIFFPLHIRPEKEGGLHFRTVRVTGSPQSGWVTLLGAEKAEGKGLDEFVGQLSSARRAWDLCNWQRIRGKQALEKLIKAAHRADLSIRYYPCARLLGTNSYSSGKDYLESRDKAFLGGVRRHYRRLSELGKLELHLFGAGTTRVANEALDAIDNIVLNSWQGKAGSSVFAHSNEPARSFHLALLKRDDDPNCRPAVSLLTLNDTPVAFQYGFQCGDHYTNYAREFDDRYPKNSPGGVLNYLYLQTLFDSGIRTVDFGVGEATDKRKWGDWVEDLYSVFVFHDRWRSTCYRICHDVRRSAKRLYLSVTKKDPLSEER